MKIRYKIITIIAVVSVLVCSMVVTTFALTYPSETDEVNTEKWQALEVVTFSNDDNNYSIVVDTHYGDNGTYTLTDGNGTVSTTKVTGDTTKKINIEPTFPTEYTPTDVVLTFRDMVAIRDRNDLGNFKPINDMYLCFDAPVDGTLTVRMTFNLVGYVLNEAGDAYILQSKSFDYSPTMTVSNTSGTVVNYSYASRIALHDINRLLMFPAEWSGFMTDANGYSIGAITDLTISIESVPSPAPLVVGLITTARNKGQNNNNRYSFAELPNITIPVSGDGYDDGYDVGYADGYYNGYNDGSDDGYADGYTDGLEANNQQAYESGYNNGLQAGVIAGYDEGYNVGLDDGVQMGYDSGYADGEEYGYNLGVNQGQDWGYEWGYDEGYADGYNVGLENGSDIPDNVGEFLGDSVGSFMDVEIAEGVTIGVILLIAITIPLIIWFMKMFAGG